MYTNYIGLFMFYTFTCMYIIWVRKFRKKSGNNIWYPWKILLFDLGISQINRSFFDSFNEMLENLKDLPGNRGFQVFDLIEIYLDEHAISIGLVLVVTIPAGLLSWGTGIESTIHRGVWVLHTFHWVLFVGQEVEEKSHLHDLMGLVIPSISTSNNQHEKTRLGPESLLIISWTTTNARKKQQHRSAEQITAKKKHLWSV